MSFKEFIKKTLVEYFIITTCITAAIAVLGMTIDPSARFGYESYFSPLVFGFISILPSLVTFSHKELSLRQTLIREIIYLILLEGMLMFFAYYTKIILSLIDIVLFAFTVLIVYIIVKLISWRLDRKEASEINKYLISFQGRD